MQILECQYNLRCVKLSMVVGKAAFLSKVGEELPTIDILHDHIQTPLVLEGDQPGNENVIEMIGNSKSMEGAFKVDSSGFG